MPTKNNHVIAIVNNKGGVGKTISTLKLAFALRNLGYSVTAGDLDGQCNLTDTLFPQQRPTPNLGHVLSDGIDINQVHQPVPSKLFYCLPSGGNLDDTNDDLVLRPLGVMRLKTSLATLRHPSQITLFDCPPNLGALTYSALIAADYVVVPTQPAQWSIAGVRRVKEKIDEVQTLLGKAPKLLGSIATLCRETSEHEQGWVDLQQADMPALLGTVPLRGGKGGIDSLDAFYLPIAQRILAEIAATASNTERTL